MNQRHTLPGLLVGGKYRLIERLGGGGMGEVYRAENTLAGRPVALKLLRPDLADDPDLGRRFFQEAHAVNRIRHPNIVDVFDAGFSENGPYIVMECLEGQSTGAVLSRLKRLSVDAAVAIGVGVLEALDAAHRAGIIHRDLKPENVFLHRADPSGPVVIKLLDFGIAKVLAPSGPTPRTHTGVVFGTPDYLSPEQALGEAVLDGRSDVFAVAILLFELLTGERPFRAATAVATAYRVVHGEVPALASVGGPSDERLEAALGKAFKKRPEERYQTAGDFARELETFSPDPARRTEALGTLLPPPSRQEPASARGTESARESGGPSEDNYARAARWQASSASGRPRSGTRAIEGDGKRTLMSGVPSVPAAPITTPPVPSAPAVPPAPASSPLSARAPSRPSQPPRESVPSRSSGPGSSRSRGAECHVRGSVLRAVDKSLIMRSGRPTRDRVIERLPKKFADEFKNGTLTGLVLYELSGLEAYASAATELAFGGDLTRWRDLGRAGFEGELVTVLRPLFRSSADIGTLVKRAVTVWARMFDFGTWTVGSDPDTKSLILRVSDFAPAPLALRQWLVGLVEQTVHAAGYPSAVVSVRLGELSRAPDLEMEIEVGSGA